MHVGVKKHEIAKLQLHTRIASKNVNVCIPLHTRVSINHLRTHTRTYIHVISAVFTVALSMYTLAR